MTRPFEGLRVVDLSDRLSGAFAARLFGDFGADVVLAEPADGHPLRKEPPFLDDSPGDERSTIHAYANWNKRSFTYSAPEELHDLIATADILVTNSDPIDSAPWSPALGFLSAQAVHLSITPHGLTGSLAETPGNNLTASARVGWSFINGYRDEPPLALPRHQVGYVGGVTGYITAAAALRRRHHGDTAEVIDVSELNAFALTVHTWSVGAVYNDMGFSYGAAGGRPRGQPGPLWNLADGRMNFGIADFHNWQEAMRVVGLPELENREDLIPDIGRHSKNLSEVALGMAESLPKLERWPVFHQLARLRCVIGVMQDIKDVTENEQLLARDFLAETTIEGKKVRAGGAPAKLSPSPWQVSRPAPVLGKHVDELNSEKRPPAPRRSKDAGELTPQALAEGPLAGIRVLSFGQAWSGTFGTELFALLGADVVQVGSLHRPDVFRRLSNRVPPGVEDASRLQHPLNTQGQYNSVNLHKREVTLDLRQDKGRELLWRLLPHFDILADNFRPTVIPAWGITLEKLNEMRPGVIWASISGYGETGPYWDYPANGATTEPMAGLSSIHGYEGDPGMNTGGLYPDPIAGYFMVATVMAALHQRDKTGEPQRVDLSMMEAINAVCGDAVVEFDATGRVPVPGGNHHPRFSPHNNYRAANDEWVALAVESDAAWQSLASEIDNPALLDAKYATMASRKDNEASLDAIIAAWCISQDATKLEQQLGNKGIAVARVRDFYSLYNLPDPTLSDTGFVSQIEHPEAGLTWLPGRPWRYSAFESAELRHAPCVGQHSREILVDELGLSEMEYDELVAAGVTGTLHDG
jgi:crotonobetainyl-CoA:carnitine CoA-transferase CaiB-like acyl-CoA transferase